MQSLQTNQDLELRLGGSSLSTIMPRNCWTEFPNVIDIDDDDSDEEDDVLVYSPRAIRFFPIPDEDLELRLGYGGVHSATGVPNHDGRGESLQTQKCIKTKYRPTSSCRHQAVEVEVVKLTCTICMDTMKEETSTICGHVFCKSCITDAIRIQKKCPTCRKELSVGNIHRIYLPGATS